MLDRVTAKSYRPESAVPDKSIVVVDDTVVEITKTWFRYQVEPVTMNREYQF